MPESEPKPKLIELVGPGAGQGWKAVLKSGKPAVVHEIPVPPAEATAAVPRLQRLFDHRHPALSPVLAWGTDPNGVWVAVEPNEGTPLSSILSRGPLTPPAAATLGAGVLSGVAALHEAGIAMGGFGATAVRVTTNGEVRLAGHPAAAVRAAPSQSDLRADVRSCGMAVCAAFGVDPAGAPAPPNIAPGLVVTMRSMASGAMGPSADRAQGAFREMAAAMLSPDREMAAQSELATRAGGREVPPITPFLPPGTVPPEARPSAPQTAVTPPAPPAPAPHIAPRREETPLRQSASYEAPDRPVQTYPSIPAITFPPPPVVPPPPVAPTPPAAPAGPPAAEPRPSPPPVPTWSEAPPPPAPFEAAPTSEPAQPAAVNTPYPPPPSAPPPGPPPVSEPPPPEPEPPKAPMPWETVTPAAAAGAAAAATSSPFSSSPPAPASPSPFSTSPPPPTAPAPAPAPAPPPAPSQATWSPVEAPVWKPGEAVPAEPLGSGFAVVETAQKAPTAPTVPGAPIAAPARKPSVARPPSGGGLPPERPAWLLPAAVAVVIIILLGIVGVFVLNRPGSPVSQVRPTPTTSGHPTASPRTTPSSSPTSTGGPRPVPTYGPSSADPVRSVQICTSASPCNIPGGSPENATSCSVTSCKLEVALYFTSVQKSVPIGYTIKFFNRCTGVTIDLPGVNTTTPASGYIVAIPTDHLAVNIPGGVKSGAIVAVSSQPAVAASTPLLIGADTC